jgi:hypothetical protein
MGLNGRDQEIEPADRIRHGRDLALENL